MFISTEEDRLWGGVLCAMCCIEMGMGMRSRFEWWMDAVRCGVVCDRAREVRWSFKCLCALLLHEKCADLLHGIVRAGHRTADRAFRFVNLVIVTSLVRLVTEEIHLVKVVQVLQAERLIPALGEDLEPCTH